jgi:hypothetical protein
MVGVHHHPVWMPGTRDSAIPPISVSWYALRWQVVFLLTSVFAIKNICKRRPSPILPSFHLCIPA